MRNEGGGFAANIIYGAMPERSIQVTSHSFPFVRSEKRRRILIALRAVVISSEVEKSFSFAVKHFM